MANEQYGGWLGDAVIRRNVPGIESPSLWGQGDRYGMDLPTGWKGPTEEDLLAIQKRHDEWDAREKEKLNKEARDMLAAGIDLTKTDRDKIIDKFHKTYGNPDTLDSDAITKKAMVGEEENIKRLLGLSPDTQVDRMNTKQRQMYYQLREAKEATVYTRAESYRQQLKNYKDTLIGKYDALMAANAEKQWDVEKFGMQKQWDLTKMGMKPGPESYKSFEEFAMKVENHLAKLFLDPIKTTIAGVGAQDREELDKMLTGLRNYMSQEVREDPDWWRGDPWVDIGMYLSRFQKDRKK